MRYGLVREAARLPPGPVQRRLLEASGCDVLLEEREASAESQQRLFKLLRALKAPDEVIVQSLDVFEKTTGELAKLLRDFLTVGVELRIVSDPATADVLSRMAAERLLTLLSEHEARRPERKGAVKAARSAEGLTRNQLEYARKLYREGASPRQIGLLFRITPNQVMELIRG